MRRISISEQVDGFLRTLAPGPKHAIRLAISKLAQGDAGAKALKNELAGFHRLAVGKYRVVYISKKDSAECFYAGERKTIYEKLKDSN